MNLDQMKRHKRRHALKTWEEKAGKSFERKGTKGALHEDLGVPEGEPIPLSKLHEAQAQGGLVAKRAQFALNATGRK